LDPQWFAWHPGDLQSEGFECQAFFFEGERFEMRAPWHHSQSGFGHAAAAHELRSVGARTPLGVREDPAAASLSQLYTLETV
jgi:hypothetical protein